MASTTPIAILSSLLTAPLKNLQNSSQNYRDQDPSTTQPEGNSTHLNYKFFWFFLDTQIFPVLVVNSLCKNIFLANSLCFPCLEKWTFKFPVFPVPWQPWL